MIKMNKFGESINFVQPFLTHVVDFHSIETMNLIQIQLLISFSICYGLNLESNCQYHWLMNLDLKSNFDKDQLRMFVIDDCSFYYC